VARKQLSKESLRWFDLSNYKKTKTMGIPGWNAVLQFRSLLRNCLHKPGLDDFVKGCLAALMDSPIPEKAYSRNTAVLGVSGPRVSDMRVIDVFYADEYFDDPRFADALEQCKKWDESLSREGIEFAFRGGHDLPLLDMSFDDYAASKGIELHSETRIFVDLHASDTQLIADFTDWLARKRLERKIKACDRPITEDDTREWARYGVLPYMDLQLFSAYTGLKFTQWQVGQLLFPNEDIDPAERIRKVVRPMAESLMEESFLAAFDNQVSRTESKTM